MLAALSDFDRSAWGKSIPRGCLVARDATILALARTKDVLHLGAADAPFTYAKAPQGTLLHQQLRAVAGSVVGVDLDKQAVDWLRERHGIADICLADASDATALPDRRFDVVACCDLIEHLDNPGRLLDAARTRLRPDGLMVVTTINATAIKIALRAITGREAVHPQHVCYYSYATLCELLLRHHLRPSRFGTFCYPTCKRISALLFNRLAAIAPGTADGLIIVAINRDS